MSKKNKSFTYEQYILLDVFELFDGKNLDQVIKDLQKWVKAQPSDPNAFKVVKSEFGMGTVIYLQTTVVEEPATNENAKDAKRRVLEQTRQQLIDFEKKEWAQLRNKHVK